MPSAAYSFDPRTMRYRDASTGRFVPRGRVYSEFNKVVAVSERRMARAAESLQKGLTTLRDFELQMRAEVKSLHLAAAVVANGGLARMDARLWGEVGWRLRREFAYLSGFASDVASGRLPLQSGRLRQRARSYVAAARAAYWQTVVRRMRETGEEVFVRRELRALEHCEGCVREAARGFVPLEEFKPIGSQECKWFCKCSLEFKVGRGERQ